MSSHERTIQALPRDLALSGGVLEPVLEHRPSKAQYRDPAGQSRLCIAVGLSFIVLAVIGAIAMAAALREAAMAQAGRNLGQLSGTAAEQVTRTLQAVDLMLQDIGMRVENEAARQHEPVEAVLRSAPVHDVLVQHMRNASQLAALALVDRGGVLASWSRSEPPPSYALSDRDFFAQLAGSIDAQSLFISEPQISRATGLPAVFVSRLVTAKSNGFDGISVGTMPIDIIDRSFERITHQSGVSVTLLRDNGAIITRAPSTDFKLGDIERPADYEGRLSSATSIPQYGLRLVVSMTESDALAIWWRQVAAIAVLTLAAAVCLLLMVWALVRQIQAQRQGQETLSERNQELEAANRRIALQAQELIVTADALRANEKLLANRSDVLKTTLEYIDQGILMVDADETVVVYNRWTCEVLGIPKELFERRPKYSEVLEYQWDHGEFEQASQDFVDFLRTGTIVTQPHSYQRERPNGKVIEINSLPLPGGGMVRTFSDITEQKLAQAQIERAALFDDLTELPNRLSLRRRLDEQLHRDPKRTALLYLNLDRFRLLNDARGYVIGNLVLQAVAGRLRECGVGADLVSRTGGDEFAAVHAITPALDDSSELAAKILRRLSEPYAINGQRLTITVSIGVATGMPGTTTDILLRNAEIAMYRAKDGGRNQLCRYDPAMATAQQERFQIEQSLREALGTPALRLAYQPIISLETNAIAGFEALLRWHDPVRGDISPADFIPIAESTGLIMRLGRSALEWACGEAASWSKPHTVAVNLSPAQFHGDDLVALVKTTLENTGLEPGRLELEVTEGMLLQDTGPVRETMVALRDLGVSLTLDDFGTGHAGLSYLRRFPFQKFKIDRSFVRNLGKAREADTIVEEMLLLARRLDLRVVAEGVELESQLERLRQMGCTYVQGYLTGRPMFAEVARTL